MSDFKVGTKIAVGGKIEVVFMGDTTPTICKVTGSGTKNGMKVYDVIDPSGMNRWCYRRQITKVLPKR